jgi:hypothetical protein
MKFRITLFIVFQVIAWTAYFNWESEVISPNAEGIAEKVVQVEEMSTSQFTSIKTQLELYNIILRNDGFFTKINTDKSLETGLWSVNYNMPSLVLKSAVGDQKYRILDNSKGVVQLELLNSEELLQASNTEIKERTLFSSVR